SKRGLAWIDGLPTRILGPGCHVMWSQPRSVRVQVFDVRLPLFEAPYRDAVMACPNASQFARELHVRPFEVGVLSLWDRPLQRFEPGRYTVWNSRDMMSLTTIETREQQVAVKRSNLFASDERPVDVAVTYEFRVTDPMLAVSSVANYARVLYSAAQSALVSAV